MRYPPEHRAEARARIVTAAARAIREKGLAKPSVVDIMERAGLTHGAFYHHFADRDALLADAVKWAAVETSERVFAEDADRASMLAAYCSSGHVDNPEEGCVLAALGTDAVHFGSPSVRAAFAATARGFVRHVARVLGASRSAHPNTEGRPRPRAAETIDDAALAVASRMIGAVVLARLVDDRKLAARLLDVARR